MYVIRLSTRVGRDHRICLELPPEVPEGEVEVIVLVSESVQDREDEQPCRLEEFFRKLDETDRPRLSKEEIDRYLEEERAS